ARSRDSILRSVSWVSSEISSRGSFICFLRISITFVATSSIGLSHPRRLLRWASFAWHLPKSRPLHQQAGGSLILKRQASPATDGQKLFNRHLESGTYKRDYSPIILD